MENYIIPANSKKSALIMGIFRGVDLTILLICAAISTILLIVLGESTLELVIKLAPLGIGVLLVWPLPFYHNVLVFLQEAYNYITGIRRYYWRGWCASYEFRDDDEKKN